MAIAPLPLIFVWVAAVNIPSQIGRHDGISWDILLLNILHSIYRTITSVALPGVWLLLDRREARGKEDPERIHERFGYAGINRPNGKLIWIHAASVGEIMSILLLIDKLAAQLPDVHFLVTSGTVTSARILASRLPPRTIHQFVPVDVASCVTRFLDHWRPDMALWIESEFWPNMLAALGTRKIPVALLNARISAKSERNWTLAKGWIAELLGVFSLCLTQTEAAQATLRNLGALNVGYVGNLKFAALPLPDAPTAHAELAAAVGKRPIWLFASSHPGEELLALQTHQALRAQYPDLLTVIAPRHPVRGTTILALIAQHGLTVAQRSLGVLPIADTEIYLADTLGELGILYRLCHICCVGGSFVPVGGHNPIEPALLDTAIIFGPLMTNFSEVAEQMVAAKAARQVQNGEELTGVLRALLAEPAAVHTLATTAQAWATAQDQVHDRIIAALDPILRQAHIR